MAQELDIDKLKEYKPAGAPFLEFRDPDEDTFYAYSLKPIEDLRNFESKLFNRVERHAIVQIVDLKPDGAAVPRTRRNEGEFVEVGATYSVNFSRHAVLKREMEKLSPIKGRIFHIMNRGKRRGKKNDYLDYVVIPVTSEMHSIQLLALERSGGRSQGRLLGQLLRHSVEEPEEGDTDI